MNGSELPSRLYGTKGLLMNGSECVAVIAVLNDSKGVSVKGVGYSKSLITSDEVVNSHV